MDALRHSIIKVWVWFGMYTGIILKEGIYLMFGPKLFPLDSQESALRSSMLLGAGAIHQ